MVIDHNRAAAKLKGVLTSANLPVPPEQLDAKHRAMLDQLRSANDDAFDKAYIETQYSVHLEALHLLKAYAKNGDNQRLKAFAADVLPPLQRHLDHVSRLR